MRSGRRRHRDLDAPSTVTVAGTSVPGLPGAGCPGVTYGAGEIALVMLDAGTGELCYRFDSERLDVAMVVVADDLLVSEEYDDDGALLVARHLSDGAERWSVPVNDQGPRGHAPGMPAGTGGGIVTVFGRDGTLQGIALEDGTVRWTADVGVDPDGPPPLRDSATTVALPDLVDEVGEWRSLVGIDRSAGRRDGGAAVDVRLPGRRVLPRSHHVLRRLPGLRRPYVQQLRARSQRVLSRVVPAQWAHLVTKPHGARCAEPSASNDGNWGAQAVDLSPAQGPGNPDPARPVTGRC